MASLSGLHLRSRLQRRRLRPLQRAIRLLVCDVDDVLTDDGLHYDEEGRLAKRFDVRDGLAVHMMQRADIAVALLSGGRSGAIEQRVRHLDIAHCRTGMGDNQAGLEALRQELGMVREATGFLGEDLNDLAVWPACGLLVAPSDAVWALRCRADWVHCRRDGGGALRDLSEALLASRSQFFELHQHGWRDHNG